MTDKPVIGILEAGVTIALRKGDKFGVVTTGEGWVAPLTKANLECLSDDEKGKFVGVVATGLGVLDFHSEEVEAKEVTKRIGNTAARLVEETGADVIVLGCAGMEGMEAAVLEGTTHAGKNVLVVDCVSAATELVCEKLAN